MKNNLILQLPVIPISQLFSNCEPSQAFLDTLYLTQHYHSKSNQMNIIPIPVKRDNSADQPRYEVLANHHIFFALKKAQYPFARCLSLNRPDEEPETWQAELQVKPAKLNITAMDQENLQQVFTYLAKKENCLAKLLSHGELIQALAEHPSRPYWSSWDPIKALAKAGQASITKKHMDCLEKYFYFKPQPLPKLCINTVSEGELSRHLHILPLEIGVGELIQALAKHPGRLYWSSWDPIKALAKAGQASITKKHMDCLEKYFYFKPQPLPKLCINTVSEGELSRHLHILPLEIGVGELIQALAKHPGRPYWSSWDPIKVLAKVRKVSITKKHMDCLEKYFYFKPQPLPKLCINTVSDSELSRHLHILPLEIGVANQLSRQFSCSTSRLYWRDFKDMTRALRAEAQSTIPKEKQTILARGFYFTPALPPAPNTVPFLLQQMTVKELRREADKRDLDHKGIEKSDLVHLLSRS